MNFIRLITLMAIISSMLLLASTDTSSVLGNQKDYLAVKLNEPIKLDGILDEPRYKTESITNFVQIEPYNGKPASQKTEVWISYTETDLYISARLHDTDPHLIRAPKNRRDQMSNSDEFQVAIDSYHDRRTGFFFVVNPSGSYQDGTVFNDNNFSDSWDGVWSRAVTIDDMGWSAELKIPFSQLRFEHSEEQIMSIGFGRFIDRKKEHSLDIYIPAGETGLVSRWNDLRGIVDIRPPRKVEVSPYISSGYNIMPSLDDNPMYNGKDSRLGVGADFKIGLGNNLTLSGTINPDFGQVEVDPSTINLSANETYYSERRPFFIEGANIFRFGSNGPSSQMNFMYMRPELFYSRRIGAPPAGYLTIPTDFEEPGNSVYNKVSSENTIIGAGKITGKINDAWSVGAFSAVTAKETGEGEVYDSLGSLIGRWDEPVSPLSGYYIGRALGEFNDGKQGLGFIGTAVQRNVNEGSLSSVYNESAYAGGIDGWWFLNNERKWVISGFYAATNVNGTKDRILNMQKNSLRYYQRPDATHLEVDTTLTSLSGSTGRLALTKDSGDLIFNTAITFTTPGFEPNDLGMYFKTDRIHTQAVLGYEWNKPTKYFNYGNIIFAKAARYNYDNDKISSMNFLTGFIKFHNNWRVNMFSGAGPRTLSDEALRGGPMVISPFGWFYDMSIMSDNRKNINYRLSFGTGGSEKGGSNESISTEVEMRVGTTLKLEVEPRLSRSTSVSQYVTVFDDPDQIEMYGGRYIVSHLEQKRFSVEMRADFSLSPDLSIQGFIQPFFAVGHYSRFKEFTSPRTYSFHEYKENQNEYLLVYDNIEDSYTLLPDGNSGKSFSFGNPDFNYKSMIGNFVLRWEFKPGSTLFLVWTRNYVNYDYPGNLNISRDFESLMKTSSENHFAMKITYWFGQ